MESSLNMQAIPHEVELDGKKYTLLFDMAAFAAAEQVYYREYGRTCNCGEIILEMLDGMLSALMAFSYGALRSGGAKMDYEAFARDALKYTQRDTLFVAVEKALIQALGADDDARESVEADAKN